MPHAGRLDLSSGHFRQSTKTVCGGSKEDDAACVWSCRETKDESFNKTAGFNKDESFVVKTEIRHRVSIYTLESSAVCQVSKRREVLYTEVLQRKAINLLKAALIVASIDSRF